MIGKSEWLRMWGFIEGTPEAEEAWARKLALPKRAPFSVGRSASYEYACPITGTHISSKRQHEENLKQHGCRVLETGERDYNERVRAQEEAAFERKVDQTIEREIALMPSDKRERLGKELTAGVTAEVTRN